MRRSSPLAALALLALVGLAAPLRAEEPTTVQVKGRVLDAEGQPLAGVGVATHWMEKEGRWVARDAVETDAEGGFTLTIRPSSRARSVMAFDAAQERGAVAALDAAAIEKPLALRLLPTTRVRGGFASPGLGHDPERMVVSFTASPAQIAVATWLGAPRFDLPLPAAEYRLGIGAVDCQRIGKRIALTADMRAVDLGVTELEPTIIARHYGKAPPAWHVTEARGVPPEVTLADYRGRWVLLEFWGHW